jgi:predicted ferric reductase
VASAVRPGALLAIIGAGAVAVLALWWHSTLAISGLGGWLTGAGEVLGLLAGYGVIVLVLLMARVTPIERGIGADRLARWHAMGGRYVIGLITAHALLIIWGYAVSAQTGLVHETGVLLTTYPDVMMATAAWFLLLAVGITSARAARKRLRYETWYYLHLYTYLAIALAFSHQFADGAAFVSDLAARFWWSALYLVVAVLVLWYRIVVPLRAVVRHGFRVAGVRQEAPRTVSIYVKGRRLRELQAEPGQFFRWRFLARGMWWQSHPYSLSAVPSDDLMRITVREVGDDSNVLRSLRPGIRVIAEGPFGAFTPARTGRSVLLLAGGVGIAPLRAMFAALTGKITLIYRASSWQDIVFRPELDAIAAAKNATVHYVVGTRTDLGVDPLSASALRQLAPGLHRMDVYLCGPPGMTGTAVAALTEAGVPRRRIHYESFEF